MSLQNAFLGSLVSDAVSMPVHWYYNRGALDRDYGDFTTYCRPRNPHPDSILWRSEYRPNNSKADILGNQLKYWGTRGIHYHQFLEEGDNTLNLQLAAELYRNCILHGGFDPETWLIRSCKGWAPEDLRRELDHVKQVSLQHENAVVADHWAGFQVRRRAEQVVEAAAAGQRRGVIAAAGAVQ